LVGPDSVHIRGVLLYPEFILKKTKLPDFVDVTGFKFLDETIMTLQNKNNIVKTIKILNN